MPKVTVQDFRIIDRVLAETEPDAGDVVFLGERGTVAYPFVVARTLAGPGGTYIDAVDIVDADGTTLGTWERRFELDGESKPKTIVNELRNVRFTEPGIFTVQYSVFDDVIANFAFQVVQQDAPATGIVPGPLDAALAKSTICWVSFLDGPIERPPLESGEPVKVPEYLAGKEWPVWYGYEEGRVYVLTGPGEQQIPGLTEATTVRVAARSKDKQSLVADVECGVDVLKKDADWDRIARDLLVGRRLNLKDGEAAVERWKRECEIVMLTPLPGASVAEETELEGAAVRD